MPKYILPPEGTIPLSELTCALVSRFLGHRWRPTHARRKTRAPTEKHIVTAWTQCQRQLLDELASGALIAHAHIEGTWPPRRIPPRYWEEEFSGLSIAGKMTDLIAGETFATEFEGSPIYVLGDNAIPWLMQHGIDHSHQFFPDELRSNKAYEAVPVTGKKRRTKKDSPIKKAFIAEGLRILHVRGGWSPEFKKANLIRQLQEWSRTKWDEEAADSTVKSYVDEIERQFSSGST